MTVVKITVGCYNSNSEKGASEYNCFNDAFTEKVTILDEKMVPTLKSGTKTEAIA